MDKSCGSFLFGTLCSTKWALAWLLAIVAGTLELWTHTHAHHCFFFAQVNNLWLRWQRRTCSGTGCTFVFFFLKEKAPTAHSQPPFVLEDSVHPFDGTGFISSVAFQAWVFQWLMEMFSHLWCYICFSSTTPLLPSDLHPDDIPVWPALSQACDEWDGLIYIIQAVLGFAGANG